MNISFEQIISLSKRRGFVFQGSEIYGGLANTWDYGPLGVELKRNIKNYWWQSFVTSRRDMFGLDSAILMNPKVWEASGHLGGFSDPLTDCRNCKNRFRADKLLDAFYKTKSISESTEGIKPEELMDKIEEYNVLCPACGKHDFTSIREFNLMFKTFQGVTQDSQALIYLRPETAQGIFINFKNILNSQRAKIPFGVAQIGKAFRNEISPSNFIFRTREFEQMEIEYFCEEHSAEAKFEYWQDFCFRWLLKIGVTDEHLQLRKHKSQELSHYSKATTDIEFMFPFGWGELWGIAHRGNFDLTQHAKFSGKDLNYFDPVTRAQYLPDVIEPSLGVDRLLLALLLSAYAEDVVSGESRIFLKLSPKIAPIKLGVLPLTKKQLPLAENIALELQKRYSLEIDVSSSIGKRYRRFDEIGTPYCITVDYDSAQDNKVTVRSRDTTKQDRIEIDQMFNYLADVCEL